VLLYEKFFLLGQFCYGIAANEEFLEESWKEVKLLRYFMNMSCLIQLRSDITPIFLRTDFLTDMLIAGRLQGVL